MHVVDTLAPIVLMVALGTFLRATGFTSAEFFRNANRLVYWVGLPTLFFEKTATSKVDIAAVLPLFTALVAATLLIIALSYGVGWLMRLPGPGLASFVQGAYRGNLAYVGMPVLLLHLAHHRLGGAGTEPQALLAVAGLVPVYNILAVVILSLGRRTHEPFTPERVGRLLVTIATNPFVVSCTLGVVWSLTGLKLPVVAMRTCAGIGQMALPLALMAVGASLSLGEVRIRAAAALTSSVLKVVCAPLIGYGLAAAMGLGERETVIALVYLATPTAVASYVMAEQLGADEHLAGATVVASTILSVIPLAVVIYLG